MELNLSINALAQQICATQKNTDPEIIIHKIASLEAAGPSDLAIILDRGDASVFDAVSLEKIKNCRAGVLLASKPVIANKPYLLVDDTLTAFNKIIEIIKTKTGLTAEFQVTPTFAYVGKNTTIHPTAHLGVNAVIHDNVTIGEQTVVGAQTIIGRCCTIGAHVLIHPGVKILDHCIIGDGSIIHAGTVIGSDGFGYAVTQKGLRKIPQIGIVVVGKMVEIGANCTIDRASFDKTIIGNGVKMDNGVHIAHNVTIGDSTAILAQTGIAGSVKIGQGCQIGGQVAIKNDLIIGNGVKIVSKSAVLNNLKDGEVVAGIPAIAFTQWKRLQVVLLRLIKQRTIIAHEYRPSLWQKIKTIISK